MRRAVIGAALVLSILAAPALAQPASAASAPTPSSAVAETARLDGARLVQALRAGGFVIYFRHTATDFSKRDDAMRSLDDCAHQRPLSEQGRSDARTIGHHIRALKLPFGEVLASPMCRTMDHARLTFGAHLPVPTPAMRESGGGDYPGLKRLLEAPVKPGTNRWMVGHGIPFRAVAGPPHLAEGEAVVMKPDAGGWTVVARIAVGDWASLSPP